MSSLGRVFRRGKFYWIAYYVHGVERRESSRSPRELDAKRLLKKRLAEIGQGVFTGSQEERVIMDELLDALEADYQLRGGRALVQFRAHLRPIRHAFGSYRAIDVIEARIDRYVTNRLADGKKPATVNRETQLLGQAFRLAVDCRVLTRAPYIRQLPERNARQGFFERAEFESVVSHLPDYLKDFARFGYLSGWRKGEIAGLEWRDVDRDAKVIRLRPEASKTHEGRVLVLDGELWTLIERRWEVRKVLAPGGDRVISWVFHRQGNPIGDMRKAWKTACRKAGVPGKLFHDLRRTSVRNMVRAGVPERVAMEVSGHRTRSIFDRYHIVSERDLREAVRKTQAYLDAQSEDQGESSPATEQKQAENKHTDKKRTK
jgi:integrase